MELGSHHRHTWKTTAVAVKHGPLVTRLMSGRSGSPTCPSGQLLRLNMDLASTESQAQRQDGYKQNVATTE